MDKELFWQNVLFGTKILRPPRHTLATFGSTTLQYVLLSPLPEEPTRCRLREGRVTADRPQILTPDFWQKRFEGFGEETELYKGVMDQFYGQNLRALEYRFKNELHSTSLEQSSLPELTERTLKALQEENAPRKALLQGPDQVWAFSVMKFIIDMSLRSYPANVRELEERGYFHPEERAQTRARGRIEQLFREAQHNPESLRALADLLKETGLFTEYEDRFFALVHHSR